MGKPLLVAVNVRQGISLSARCVRAYALFSRHGEIGQGKSVRSSVRVSVRGSVSIRKLLIIFLQLTAEPHKQGAGGEMDERQVRRVRVWISGLRPVEGQLDPLKDVFGIISVINALPACSAQ